MSLESPHPDASQPSNRAAEQQPALDAHLQRQLNGFGKKLELLQWSYFVTGNAHAWSRLDPDRLHALPEYRRVREVTQLLKASRVEGIPFTRFGSEADGGYVMLDSLRPPEVMAGYSIGIGTEISWDLAVAKRGIELVLYDHTVAGPPQTVPGARFVRQGICGTAAAPGRRTLAEMIADNGHEGRSDLVLKMDAEGAEWEVLDEVRSDTLGQFAQIAIEFHRMAKVLHAQGHAEVVAAISKLAHTHVPVHAHGNNCRLPVWIGDLVLPDVLEVSWVRRADYEGRIVPRTESFPTDDDRPNLAHRPDLFLGWTFSFDRPGSPQRDAGPSV